MFDSENFDSLIKYSDSNYWFVPTGYCKYSVIETNGKPVDKWADHVIATFQVKNNEMCVREIDTPNFQELAGIMPDIRAAWVKYIERPEYQINISADTSNLDLMNLYERKLVGSVFITELKIGHDPDNSWRRVERCLEWLRKTDFYTCPASTQYHDSYEGGLLAHSVAVADRALQLVQSPAFSGVVNVEDAVFTALVHDWCKIGLYQPYMKNIKDESTNKWMAVQAYKYVEDRTICLGHGVSSMYIVMKLFNISMEVALAIRWHMGRWNVIDAEINELQQANRNYPLVHLIQFADQLSITNY